MHFLQKIFNSFSILKIELNSNSKYFILDTFRPFKEALEFVKEKTSILVFFSLLWRLQVLLMNKVFLCNLNFQISFFVHNLNLKHFEGFKFDLKRIDFNFAVILKTFNYSEQDLD